MPKRHLRWHLFPSYVAVATLTAVGIGWFAVNQFEQSSLRIALNDRSAVAEFLKGQLATEGTEDRQAFAAVCRRFHAASDMRVALVEGEDKVDFDSHNRPEEFEAQPGRSEIKLALAG